MKILQVMAGAKHGGAETAFVDMCVAMHEAGEDVQVVTRENKIRATRLRGAGVTVHTLPFGGKIDVFTPWRLQQIIKAFKPDIVQTWMSRASDITPQWKNSMNIPRYLNVARLGTPYKMKYFKKSEYFISITPDIRKYLIEQGVAEDRVRHINNFAEVEPIHTPIQRSDYDTPENVTLLLGLGRLHRDKAFDTLIKAVSELPEVHLWIAGEGPLRAELEALIKALNVENRVKLLGWQTDRAALFNVCDICTFTSRDEGFGTVFVQSWALKTPVIVSDADGPRQFVRDGEDGLIVPADDAEAIKEAVQKIINNKELSDKFIENGYKRYEDEFTKEKAISEYLGYYHEIREREDLS